MLCSVRPFCAVLCLVVSCRVVLCCAVSCRVLLCRLCYINMCVCVCVCVCVRVYVYVHIFCMCVSVYAYVCLSIGVFICVRVCVCVCVCVMVGNHRQNYLISEENCQIVSFKKCDLLIMTQATQCLKGTGSIQKCVNLADNRKAEPLAHR